MKLFYKVDKDKLPKAFILLCDTMNKLDYICNTFKSEFPKDHYKFQYLNVYRGMTSFLIINNQITSINNWKYYLNVINYNKDMFYTLMDNFDVYKGIEDS